MVFKVSIHGRPNFGKNMVKQSIMVEGTCGRERNSFPSRWEAKINKKKQVRKGGREGEVEVGDKPHPSGHDSPHHTHI